MDRENQLLFQWPVVIICDDGTLKKCLDLRGEVVVVTNGADCEKSDGLRRYYLKVLITFKYPV